MADERSGIIEHIADIAVHISDCLERGGTVFTCGNGGSACEAQHLAEELVGHYRADREGFAAVCLSGDASLMSCVGNDFGFDYIFARPLKAMGHPDDTLVVFSTSGRSPNVLEALRVASEMGIYRIGFLGTPLDNPPALVMCDKKFVAPSAFTDVAQECHQVALHCILEVLEAEHD